MLVLLINPFLLLLIVTFLRLGSACSSSSSLCAASLAWAKWPRALLYNTCSPSLPGWPLHLGVPLPPWNSKDKRWCFYKRPYVAAPVRVLDVIIVKTMPCMQLPSDAPTRTINFSWFTDDTFLRRPILSYQDSYVHSLQGGLHTKVVTERNTYCTWRVPQQVPSSVSSRLLRSDVGTWAQTSGNQKFKMTARKGRWAFSPYSRASLPLSF